MMRLPKLEILETYTSPEVILKFARDYNIAESQARMIFKETLKMLWLMVKHMLEIKMGGANQTPEAFNVHKPMEPLDKMWHEFILFTQEYHQFCEDFFGCYIHHVPCSEKEYQAFKQRASEQKDEFIACERKSIAKFVRYIQENLGNETLKCWFMGMPALRYQQL